MKKTPISVLVALGIVLFSSCSKSEKITEDKKVLSINVSSDPYSLDPRRARDLASGNIIRMLFEGLTRIDLSGQPSLALAESCFISEDGKTYTFKIKEAYWSNGDQVTADDFAYSWKKTISPEFSSDNAYHLFILENAKSIKEGKLPVDSLGIKALDDKTLEVKLSEPATYFLELLSFPCFFPINAKWDQEHGGWENNVEHFVSNGPFRISGWQHAHEIKVVKNTSYWDANSVVLDGINMVMVSDETELKMFEKGELDYAGSPFSTVPVDAIAHFDQKGVLQKKGLLGTYFFRVNTEKPYLNSPHFRKALAYAVNRKDIVEHVTQGGQLPATGLVPTTMNFQKEPYFEDGNISKAQVELQGCVNSASNKNPVTVKLMYSANQRNHLIAQAVQQQWKANLNIDLQLEAVEAKVFFDRLSKKNYELATGSWIADFNDPINFLEVFKYKSSGTNNTNWEDSQYVELLDKSSNPLFASNRMQILRESEEKIMEQMPIIPIFHYTMLYLQNPKVKNIALSSLGVIDFKWATLE